MQRKVSRYYTAVVFLATYVVAYTLALVFPLPLPRYYPIEHTWRWTTLPDVPSMGWYGLVTFALLVSGLVTLMARIIFKHIPKEQKHVAARSHRMLAWMMVVILVGALTYIALHELQRWGILAG